MIEYQVYQIIFFREKLGIFVEHITGGGGELYTFRGSGEEPRCELEELDTSPFRDAKYAGSKLLGKMKRSDVDKAWKLCRDYVEDDNNEHEEITDWCVGTAAMLAKEGLIVTKPWWTIR